MENWTFADRSRAVAGATIQVSTLAYTIIRDQVSASSNNIKTRFLSLVQVEYQYTGCISFLESPKSIVFDFSKNDGIQYQLRLVHS